MTFIYFFQKCTRKKKKIIKLSELVFIWWVRLQKKRQIEVQFKFITIDANWIGVILAVLAVFVLGICDKSWGKRWQFYWNWEFYM